MHRKTTPVPLIISNTFDIASQLCTFEGVAFYNSNMNNLMPDVLRILHVYAKPALVSASSRLIHYLNIFDVHSCICVASLQKGPNVAKIKNEIFVDLYRAGHDKSVEKKFGVLAQIFTKLWSIYELHNYIILIIILNIII